MQGIVPYMRLVKYQGKRDNIGRFGTVEGGSILSLNESEYQSVRGDRRFKPLTKPTDEEAKGISPAQTAEYNLLSINWANKHLLDVLKGFGRPRLKKIAGAMESLGLSVPHSGSYQRIVLASRIYEAASIEGWTLLSRSDLQRLQTSKEETPKEEEEPNKEETE